MQTMFLYRDITLLNRDNHRTLRVAPANDLSFSTDTHIIPLAADEFLDSAKDFPVLFVRDAQEKVVPVALLGLEAGRNEWLDGDARWAKDTYVPAFIRRYPFVLASTAEDRFSVCFDAAFKGMNEQHGEPLFDESGNNTKFLDEVIHFLQEFTAAMRRTEAFVDALQRHELLQPKTLTIRNDQGNSFVINDFIGIDEERFQALGESEKAEFCRNGWYHWVTAHWISLRTAGRLFSRHLERKASLADDKTAAPLAKPDQDADVAAGKSKEKGATSTKRTRH